MTILILEDEMRAGERLRKLVQELRPNATVPEPLESIEEALNWFGSNPEPEIILMDIELADGKSFELFNHRKFSSKIIFCTAFDQYALEAFNYHGVAYLLKPVKKEKLSEAFERAEYDHTKIDYDELAEAVARREDKYQKRLLVKLGQRYKTIPTNEISYVFTEAKNVMVMTNEGKEIPVDESMEQLEHILNPKDFFRINRKFIVSHHAIDNMYAWSRSRVKLELIPNKNMEAIVATDRASNFKSWLEGK